jgi:hypothetical protein
MRDIHGLTDEAIAEVIQEFQVNPQVYFTEEDVRWRLMKGLEIRLSKQGGQDVQLRDGHTSTIHGEYPTPFRCSMIGRLFRLADIQSKAQRGHFDVVLLNFSAAAQCTFEIVRSQYYQAFLRALPQMPLPFLDCIVEIKLYRDLAHPNRTESAGQQAEHAVQDVNKVVAALDAQPGYYRQPFALRGIVLMLDNSHLACSGDALGARHYFRQTFEQALDFRSLPDTFSAIWATPDEKQQYRGMRQPHTSLEDVVQ